MTITDCSRVELCCNDGGRSVGTSEPSEIARIAEAIAEAKSGTTQFIELPISGYYVNLSNVSYIRLI